MAMWWAGVYGSTSMASAAHGQALDASAKADQANTQIEFLARDVERLSMVTQALWQILKDEHGYDDEVLRKKVMEIDLADRTEGGHAPQPCDQCHRPLARRHAHCLYCGAARKVDPFER